MNMPSRLLLSFTGLCWFAPKYPIEDNARRDSNAMTVLLAESSRHPPGSRMHPHEPHLPVLVTPAAGVVHDGSSREPDACFRLKDETHWAVFFLDDQDIQVLPAGPERLTVLYSPNSGSGCPTAETYDSFGWVGPLARMTPGSEVLEDGCIGHYAGPYDVNPDVVARLTLTEGTIGTWSFASDPDTRQIIEWETRRWRWWFRQHRQALADSVMCLVTVKTAFVELETTLFQYRTTLNPRVNCVFTDSRQRRIRLRPDRDGFIHAQVRNMPWLDISAQREPQDPDETDVHFAHVYKLSRNPRGSNIPRTLRLCDKIDPNAGTSVFWQLRRELGEQGFFHQGRPTCPPAQGSAVR